MDYSFTNAKGGVGKTSIAAGFASILAKGIEDAEGNIIRSPKKVLVIDLDPQKNLTRLFSKEDFPLDQTVYQGFFEPYTLTVHETEIENLYLCPSHHELRNIDVQLAAFEDRDKRLRQAVNRVIKEQEFDHVIIDCPPSQGVLTRSAYLATKNLIVIAAAERFSIDGISLVSELVQELRQTYQKDIKIAKIYLNKYYPLKKKESDIELHTVSRFANLELKTHSEFGQYYSDIKLPFSDSMNTSQWYYKDISSTAIKSRIRLAIEEMIMELITEDEEANIEANENIN